MAFLKSKVFGLWAGLNAAFPTFVTLMFRAVDLTMGTQRAFAFLTIGIILAGNIYAMVKHPKYRKLFGITIFLNLFSFVMLSDVSFFTSIPQLPFLFESLYQMATQ